VKEGFEIRVENDSDTDENKEVKVGRKKESREDMKRESQKIFWKEGFEIKSDLVGSGE
jgi:hypothetical protein